MEKEKAIDIFNKWMDCKDAYQADPSCDGNCFSCEYYASAEEEKEAMQMAISALEKQEQDRWIPVTERLPEESEWIGTKHFGTTISDEVYVTFEAPSGERFARHMMFQNGRLSRHDQRVMDTVFKGAKPIAWRPYPEPYKGDL